MKRNLANLGTALSRSQAKHIMGGAAQQSLTAGTCCAHSAGWTSGVCGVSKDDAQNAGYQYWCCDSCASSCANSGMVFCDLILP